MKYLLLPFTILIIFLLSYYGIYLAVIGIAFVFSLGLFLIIIGHLFLLTIIGFIFLGIPNLLNILLVLLYGSNRLSFILHSLAGLMGVICIFALFIYNPPTVTNGIDTSFIIIGMWQVSPVKTIILVPIFGGAILSLIWTTVVTPLLLMFEN